MPYSDKVKDSLRRLNPEAVLAEGFDAALIGYAEIEKGFVALYSVQRCIQVLETEQGIDELDAREHLDFNVIGNFLGEYTPLFVEEPWL